MCDERAYLKELIHSLRDSHVALHDGMGQLEVGRRALGNLSWSRFVLLVHLRRLLGILRVEIAPFLDPVMGRPRSLNYEPPRDILFVACSLELEDIELLLAVKVDAEVPGRNKLSQTVSFNPKCPQKRDLRVSRPQTSRRDSPCHSRPCGSRSASSGRLSPCP